jgi:hypothetical protein
MDKSAFEGSAGGPAALRDGEVVAPQLWYELILRRCGLTFRSARLADVMAIVRDQTKLRGLPNEAAYYQLLSKSEDSATEWTRWSNASSTTRRRSSDTRRRSTR